ncbi:hypothetical protein Ae201684P_013273 [Aphanomyces euteiches]|uniref:Isopenicillin N synthase-like Fe(2+) 2OG dioxygenase domain-containing protein n=1 Tax=Aphanomyces euteiches TaxID=100861 RepID=A0A6G0WS35_9STRA|nr:hypothetical protein Ae201684_012239 [Aphanomyces euteiches]KAH9096607.1 hypothetical protein Ae201684P_013273 [Aphanomyces euteiches]KAH9144491.1 hypothetical protein AeRB84_011574 [Aphanomyces euteiches]
MQLSIALLACIAAVQAAFPKYEIPAFDVTKTADAPLLVAALKTSGIVALKNIPNYETTRDAYLDAAARCVSASHGNVLHKRLVDGTQRRTLSTRADSDLVPESLTDACPDYVETLKAFNAVVDEAGIAFAKALDATTADVTSKPMETVMTTGKHLNHLHAYENPSQSEAVASDLSLELHTDNGLFIMMSAPRFVDGDNHVVANPDENAGLIVKLNGTEYRPEQKDNELVIMIGQAFNEWTNLGHQFPAVLHGMVMPRNAPADTKRLFFGRMILVSDDTVLANAKMTFREYADSNRRFLLGESTDVASFACPIHRQLASSDPSCTLGIWTRSSDSPSNVTDAVCMRDCNMNATMKAAAERCLSNKCVKTSDVANGGTMCWMLCVQKFTDDVCPPQSAQCVNQTLVCQSGNVTAAPSAMNSSNMTMTTAPMSMNMATTTAAPAPMSMNMSKTTTAPNATTTPSSMANTIAMNAVFVVAAALATVL